MADNFKNLIDKISKLTDALEDSNNREYIEDMNMKSLGTFVSSLEQLKALQTNPNMNVSHIFKNLNESLVSLEATAGKGVSGVVKEIQSQLVQGFTDIGKTTPQIISENIQQINNVTNRMGTVFNNMTKRATIGTNNIINTVHNEIGRTLTIVNDEAYKALKEESANIKKNNFMRNEIFSGDTTISSRQTKMRAMIDRYQKMNYLIEGSYDTLLNQLAGVAKGMSDTDYKKIATIAGKDPFVDMMQNVYNSLTENAKGHLNNATGKTITKGNVRTYAGFMEAGNHQEVTQDILKDFASLRELLDGTYTRSRIKQMGGKDSDIANVKTLDLTKDFVNTMKTLEKNGIGMHMEETSKGIKFGLFDSTKTNEIFSTKDGKTIADWTKMAKFTMGVPKSQGSGVQINGLNFADQFRTFNAKTDLGFNTGITTVSSQMWQQFFDMVASQATKTQGFVGKIKSNDVDSASKEIGRFFQDIVNGAYGANKFVDSKGASTNAVYRDLPTLAKDIMGDAFAGSSVTQRMLRNNRIDFSEQLRGQFEQVFGEEASSQDLERMMNYIYAKIQGTDGFLKNQTEYKDLFAKGSQFLDPTADLIKKIAPYAGISSLKEGNYLFGQLAGVDTGILNPWNPLTSASYRGISQGANHVKAATKRNNTMFNEAFFRSGVAETFGVNYSDAENLVMNMAETNDSTIQSALSSYYDNVSEDELKKLYNRYISKKRSNISSDKMREALKQRIMPSTYNGGMVLNEKVVNDLNGYQPRRVELTEGDLRRLGIDTLPDEVSPIKELNRDAIKKQIQLSSGKSLTTQDKLNNLFYENGKYYLDFDKFVGTKEFAKMLTGAGGRFTTNMNNILTSGEYNAVLSAMGLTPDMNIGALVEATKDDARKMAAQSGESWEGLLQQARIAGKDYNAISEVLKKHKLMNDDGTGFLFEKNGAFYSNALSKKLMEEKLPQWDLDFEKLYNTGKGSLFNTVANELLGSDRAEAFIKNRVHASSVNKANEYTYFNPIGSVSDEVAKQRSHVKLSTRETEAVARSIGMLRQISGDSTVKIGDSNVGIVDSYKSMLDNYMGISPEDRIEADNIYKALNHAYRLSSNREYFEKNSANLENAENLNENFDTLLNAKTWLQGGTLSKPDYENTFLGRVALNNKQIGKLDLGRTISLADGSEVSTVYVPNLESRKMKDGTYSPYGAIEAALSQLGKTLAKGEGASDDEIRDKLGNYYASLRNEMESSDGYVKSILNGKKMTNAGAMKATAGNFAPTKLGENTVVVNTDYLKQMLRTGEGGDLNKNIGNLEELYRIMSEEASGVLGKKFDPDAFDKQLTKLGRNQIGKYKLGKDGQNNYQNALINKIAELTNVNRGSVGLQSLFHRYPFTQGLDEKNIKLRTSDSVGFGQFMASRGLAQQVNLDYDGDTSYIKTPFLSALSREQLRAAYTGSKQLSDINEFVTQQLADLQGESNTANDHAGFRNALNQLTGESGNLHDYITGVLSKSNFQHVGRLSNFAEHIRNGLTANGVDEVGSVMNSAKATIMRALFEQIEQDSISAKKVSERLATATGGDASKLTKNMIDSDIYRHMSAITNLMDSMKAWSGKNGNTNDLLNEISEGQFIDFNKGNRTTIEAQARIEKMLQLQAFKEAGGDNKKAEALYEQRLKELGLKYSQITNVYGKSTKNKNAGAINFEAYSKSINALKSDNPELFKEGMRLTFAHKGSNDISGERALEDVIKRAGGYSQIVEEAETNRMLSDSGAKANIYLERLVELIEQLAGVSQKAASTISSTNDSFAKNAIETDKQRRAAIAGAKEYSINGMSFHAIKARQNVGYDTNHLYDLGDSKDLHQDYSVTELGNLLTGSGVHSAQGMAIEQALQSRSKQLISANADERMAILSDQLNYEDFGYDSHDALLRDSKGIVSSKFGTLQHSVTEHTTRITDLLNEAAQTSSQVIKKQIQQVLNNGVNDYDSILGLQDLAKTMQRSKTASSYGNKLAGYIKTVSDLGADYSNTLGWLGVGQSDIQGDLQYLNQVSKNIYNWTHATDSNGRQIRDVVSTEQAMGMRLYDSQTGKGFNVAGAVDSMVYDEVTKQLTFLDNKNTGRISAGNVFQQLLYQVMGETLQSDMREQIGRWISANQGSQFVDSKNNITAKGYEELTKLSESGDMKFRWATGNKKLIRALYEGEISTAFAHNDKDGVTRIQDVSKNTKVALDAIRSFFETGQKLDTDQIKAIQGLASRVARERGFIEPDSEVSRFNWVPAEMKSDKVIASEDKSSQSLYARKALAGQKELDNARAKAAKLEQQITASQSNPKRMQGLQAELKAQQDIISLLERKKIIIDQTTGAVSQMVYDPMTGSYVPQAVMSSDGQTQLTLTKEQLADYNDKYEKQQIYNQRNMKAAQVPQRTLGSFVGEVAGNMKNTLRYLTNTSLAYGVIGKVKQTFTTMISTVEALDKAMVDLQIATGNTREEMSKSVSEYNKIAMEMGRTTQEVMTAANDWLRAGFNTQDTNLLVQESMKLSTLGMIDAAKATEYLISTMKGWKISAEDMGEVVDELTNLDMAYATSAGDIAQAMAKANVSASLAGVDRQQYEAMLTAVMDVGQQGADVVGTAFKSLFSRYGNVKSGKYSKTYTGDTEIDGSTTALNDVETVLNKIGITTRETVGEFRDMYDVLEEIATKWRTLDEVSQNAISTALGGTRQREVLNTLFENWDSVQKGEQIIARSEGTADKKMDIYENSIQAAKTRMTTALESHVTNGTLNIMGISIKSEDILTNIYDVLTDLIENLNSLVNIGLGLLIIFKGKKIGNVLMNTMSNGIKGVSNISQKGAHLFTNLTDVPNRAKEYMQTQLNDIIYGNFNQQIDSTVTGMSEVQKKKLGLQVVEAGELEDSKKMLNNVYKSKHGYQTIGNFANTNFDDFKNSSLSRTLTLAQNLDHQVFQALDDVGLSLSGSNAQVGAALLQGGNVVGAAKEDVLQSIMSHKGVSYAQAEVELDNLIVAIKNATNAMNENARSALKSASAEELDAAAEMQDTVGGTTINANHVTGVKGIVGAGGLKGYDVPQNAGWFKKTAMNPKFQAATSAGSMVASMAGGIMTQKVVGGTGWSEGEQTAATTISSMAPMVGAAFGPWGALAGIIISGATSIFALIKDDQTETYEEIKEAADEAAETLSKWEENIQEATDSNSELTDSSARFAELLKGVDLSTGMNISLDTSEWQEYQSILEKIIDASTDLYKSYDAQGNIIAKSHSGFVDSNSVLSETIQQNKEEIQRNAKNIALAKGERKDLIKGAIADAEKEATLADNKDNAWGLDWNEFYISSKSPEKGTPSLESGIKAFGRFISQGFGIARLFGKDEDGKSYATAGEAFKSSFSDVHNVDGEETLDKIEDYVRNAVKLNYTTDRMLKDLFAMDIRHGYAGNKATEADLLQMIDGIRNEMDAEEVKYNKVNEAYVASLMEGVVAELQANPFYLNFTTETQSFLQKLIGEITPDAYQKKQDGTYRMNGDQRVKKTETQIQEDIERYQQAASLLVNWTQNNQPKLQMLQNFDSQNASAADWATREMIVGDIIDTVSRIDTNGDNTVDNKDTIDYDVQLEYLEANGYSVNEKNIRRNSQGKIIGFKDNDGKDVTNIFDVAQDQKEQIWNAQGDDGITLGSKIQNLYQGAKPHDFTIAELQILKQNIGDFSDLQNTSSINTVKERINAIKLGSTAQASEYYSTFKAKLTADGLNVAEEDNVVKALLSDKYQNNYNVQQLKNIAEQIGLDSNNVDDMKKFIENIDLLGDIDGLGHTSKSLTQIQEQFKSIQDILQDIRVDGTISLENLATILEEFPELAPYIDDMDELMNKLEEMGDLVSVKQQAAIKTSLDNNTHYWNQSIDEQYDNFDWADNQWKEQMKAFKTGTNFRTLYADMNAHNAFGKDTTYWDKATGDNFYAQSSIYKDLAKMLDVNTTEGTTAQINENLYNAMLNALKDSGAINKNDSLYDSTYASKGQDGLQTLASMFTGMSKASPKYIATYQTYMQQMDRLVDLQSQLSAAEAYNAMEDEYWDEAVSNAFSELKSAYQEGSATSEDYIAQLQRLASEVKSNEELQRELAEAIEDAQYDKIKNDFENGTKSAKEFRQELSKLIHQQAEGSPEYDDMVNTYLSSFDSEVSKIQAQRDLLDEHDYNGRKQSIEEENVILQDKLAALIAAQRKESEEYYKILNQIKQNKIEQLELDKASLEHQIDQRKTVMDAYSSLADYAIEQLNEQIDLINEVYDDEISKLEEINEQKQRSIELTKLQQELENARKEKSRVYVAGIGWQYQENKAKVKETKQNLENYLDERKITDLKTAQEKEVELIQKQINKFEEIKQVIGRVESRVSATTALNQLIYNGVIPADSTLSEAINAMLTATTVDTNGHIDGITNKLSSIMGEYANLQAALDPINNALDKNKAGIAQDVSTMVVSTAAIQRHTEALQGALSSLPEALTNLQSSFTAIDTSALQTAITDAKSVLDSISQSLKLVLYQKVTTSDGTWGNNQKGYNKFTGKYDLDQQYGNIYTNADSKTDKETGITYYQFYNTENQKYWWTDVYGKPGSVVSKDTNYWSATQLYNAGVSELWWHAQNGYSSGIENGPVSYTGLAMLHGTPSNPEFVLNSDQAYTLLRNLSTMTIGSPYRAPQIDSHNNSTKSTQYIFNGDLHLPNVQRPNEFFSELLKQANTQFGVIKKNYD